MDSENIDTKLVSIQKDEKFANWDMSTLIRDFSNGRLSNRVEFSDYEIQILSDHYIRNYVADEKVYKVFATCFIERRMWIKARLYLYSRLYLLDKNSEDYIETINLINNVSEKIVEEILPLPNPLLEKLFLRQRNFNFSSWKSMMNYTEELKPYSYGSINYNYALTFVSTTHLSPGDLIMKTVPLVVAPWSIKSYSDLNALNAETYCCFHCLSVINKSFHSLTEDKRLIACPKRPRECSRYFCSRECFLKNGALHSRECDHLKKLQTFSEHFLNPSLLLLVCRTLIKCGLNMERTSRVCEINSDIDFSHELLDSLLNFNLDYNILNTYHNNFIEHIDRFASFLLDSFGFEFCLHLTPRELVHLTLVLWVNSVPVTSYLNYSCEDELTMGGTVFSFKTIEFKQSHTPNCVVHLDDSGKLTVRSIYEIPSGSELTINTFIDKYLPPFIQIRKFWSVSSLLSRDPNDTKTGEFFKDLTSIRCRNCLNSFSYCKSYLNYPNTKKEGKKPLVNYLWECKCCNSPENYELDLLQNKAENTFNRAQRLYLDGEFLTCKNILSDFVTKWSSVLHPGHYLMYNSYLLLSGMCMNRPGGSVQESLAYFRSALISADKVLPPVCYERAYLYERFAEYLLRMKSYVRLKNDDYDKLKRLIMSSLFNSLWNWTVISGTDSYQSICAMQRCRKVGFLLNIHTFPLSTQFIVNVPSKYVEVFRAATGSKTVPQSFSKRLSSESYHKNLQNSQFSGYNKDENNQWENKDKVEDVAEMAFRAAQSGEYNDNILEVLTSVQSYGLHHLGTGLSVLGIVSSNLNLDFFGALLDSIYERLTKYLEILSGCTESDEESQKLEVYVSNLFYSVLGPNEMGVTPFLAICISPNKPFNSYSSDSEITLNLEKPMASLMVGFCVKFSELLNTYRIKINKNVVSEGFSKFLNSNTDFKSILLNTTTHPMLNCQTVLHCAASKGKNDLVKYFVKQGSHVDSLNLDGASPIHLASFNGNTEVVATLINLKANFKLPLKTGETPLHLAVYGLHKDTVLKLLEFINNEESYESVGPSVWHALVCGVFRVPFDDQESDPSGEFQGQGLKNMGKTIENIMDKLSRAVEVAKVLIKAKDSGLKLEVYIWANFLPSQLLQELWNRKFDKSSLFCFPKRPPSVYVVSHANGLMEKPLKTLSAIDSDGHIGLYGSLRETKYDVNNYNELNDKNDGIFTATRTFQFLVEILKDIEDKLPE